MVFHEFLEGRRWQALLVAFYCLESQDFIDRAELERTLRLLAAASRRSLGFCLIASSRQLRDEDLVQDPIGDRLRILDRRAGI